MRFFFGKEPVGQIVITCSKEANNIYSVKVHGSKILIPNPMEKDLKNVIGKYINGFGYEDPKPNKFV